MATEILPTQDILNAYRCGLFPMADSAETHEYYWYDPEIRGQLSIDNLHISRSLESEVTNFSLTVTCDKAFSDVIDECARMTDDRPKTWINEPIREMFIALHKEGHAHSVECWEGDKLVGGLYGLAFGGIFAGESMFSRVSNASKIALVHLCARLWKAGFRVLDTQFINDHLLQFGAHEIPRDEYKQLIVKYGFLDADFMLSDYKGSEQELVGEYLACKS